MNIGGSYDTLEGITNVLVVSDDSIIVLQEAYLNDNTININGETIELSKTIDLTYEDDNVSVSRNNVIVTSNKGNDTITNYGANVTIDGGEGNDSNSNFGDNVIFNYSGGNDTIQNANDKTAFLFADVSLDQILETNITAESVYVRFDDGGSLQIQGTSHITYQIADGSKYYANHTGLEWESR